MADHNASGAGRASSVNGDPDVLNAMRGVYTGKYAAFAASLPASWDAHTRNMVVAQQVARDKGFDTSGLSAGGSSFTNANDDPWYLKPQYAIPMVLGGGLAAGALAGPAAAGAVAPSMGDAAASAPGAFGPMASGYAGATTSAAVPSALATGTGAVAPAVAHGGASLMGVSGNTLFTGGSQLFGNLFGAWMQGKAADKAAAAETAAAKYATDAQTKAQADALAFQRSEAENAYQNSEVARRGNYDLYAAGQRRLGTLGEEVGMGPREIPSYQPGVDPGYTGAGTIGAAANGPASSVPGGDYQSFFNGLVQGKAPSPAMLASLEPQLNAKGIQVHRNAAGQASKIILPGGQVVDPGIAFGTNDPAQMKWAWQVDQGGGGAPAPRAAAPAYTPISVPFLNSTPVAPALGYLNSY